MQTETPAATGSQTPPTRSEVHQYSRAALFAIWLAAAAPMGVGAWVVAPAIAGSAASPRRFAETLISVMTAGLIWQFLLVVGLVGYEQRTLRLSVLRDALWLNQPTNAAGRRGGRLWWWAPVLVVGVGLAQAVPLDPTGPASHELGAVLGSDYGHAMLRGNWGLLALIVVLAVFNTVLGEELLFRGLLLPRMRGACGRADWAVNGLIFGLYHVLSQPWSIPSAIVTGMIGAYGTRRLRSAWLGIIAHSAQSVFFITLSLVIVLS
jgi:membrane protease YdiL (CAAX protease family)